MQTLIKKLFHIYYKDVYAYLYSLTRSTSLSEDLASEVFLEVVKSIASFRSESDIKTWLFTIARRRWIAYLKKEKKEIQMETLLEFYEDKKQNVEKNYYQQVLLERIYELLNEEPERIRNIVLMRMQGYSYYEIGKMFDISENSARVIDFRAKTKIRNQLKKEGYNYE